ncbi:NAD(P)/FAD-dependent oxidoreductase, partial [Leptolyngbya sp. FACHB-36]|uniref:FAD-dependent oxidoreductase n=1 Tax=Leptolyngbya sp. FACHB-36 TaxID=2692808 RepID=UPI00168113A0
HILHLEDPQAAYLIQAQLEAEGVQILTQTAVTQVRQISGEKWVQAGNRAIEADEIIAAEAPADPAPLNLAAAQVKSSPWGIVVNCKLQTSNPRIYACLSSLPDSPQVVRYCAETAVKNALFLPVFITDLRSIPIVTYSQPELARVGHSEAIARQLYGNDVVILKQPLKLIPKTQIQGETTGLCKLILRRSGRIVGAHIVAPHASELISPIALAMQQKLTVQALADQIHPAFALSEIIRQTALEWHQTRSNLFQDFLAGLFSLRRSWS